MRWLIKPEGTLRECLVVFAAVVGAYVFLRGSGLFFVGAFNDDGAYTMLGKSLADGKGYRLPYLLGDPVAVKYPPGLPALLAIPWALGGTLAAVRATIGILNPIVCGLAAAVIWWIGRRDLALSRGPLAVAAIGPFLLDAAIQYYNIALSEPYFLLGWAISLALTGSATRTGEALALGLVLAVTTLFRSAGVVLIPACLAALALRRVPWRVVGIAAAAAIAPLIVWAVVHGRLVAQGPLSSSPDEVSYWSLIPSGSELPAYLLRALPSNGGIYFSKLSSALAGSAVLGNLLVIGVLVTAAVGAFLSWRRAPAITLTVVGSLAVVLIWPFAQDRFLLPVLPFIGLLAAVAVTRGAARMPARLRMVAPLGLALVSLVVGLRQAELRSLAASSFMRGTAPAQRDVSIFFILAASSRHIGVLSEWVRANTTPQDRLLVDFPAATHMYSGRETASASPAESPYALSVFRHPGRYLASRILEDSITVVAIGIRGRLMRDIETIASACPAVLQRVALNAEFFRVTRDEPCLRRIAPP
ncbi:MAG: hypothetical protein WD802_10190 [Gemmatimonadaceae bacterium]